VTASFCDLVWVQPISDVFGITCAQVRVAARNQYHFEPQHVITKLVVTNVLLPGLEAAT